MNRRALVMVLLAAGVCGCSTGTEPDADRLSGPFTTDATMYTATRTSAGGTANAFLYRFTAITRYTNATRTSIQLPVCALRGPEPLSGVTGVDDPLPNGWIVYGSGAFICVSGIQWIVVAPGATRVDTLRLEGTALVNSTGTTSPWVVEGRFRIFIEAMSCPTPDACTPAPDEQRRSSPFTVRAS